MAWNRSVGQLLIHFMHGSGSFDSGDSTSRSLLRRVQQQEPAAWHRFAHLYTPLVHRWCKNAGLQPHDANDIVQEVFQSVFRAIGKFRRDEAGQSLRGWLWTVTRNKIYDHHRRRAEQPAATGETSRFVNLPDNPPESDDDVAAELAHRALSLLQTDFEPTTWKAFWAMAVEGRTAQEAADEVGITLAAAFKAKSRVLNRLRQELDGLWG